MENGNGEMKGWQLPFFSIWTGQALSLVGSRLVQFALVWWLTAETGSAAVLATATLLGIAPQTVLGPFIGALVDRWNRKRIMLLADAGIALASLVLVILFAFDLATVGGVLAMAVTTTLLTVWLSPTLVALIVQYSMLVIAACSVRKA